MYTVGLQTASVARRRTAKVFIVPGYRQSGKIDLEAAILLALWQGRSRERNSVRYIVRKRVVSGTIAGSNGTVRKELRC